MTSEASTTFVFVQLPVSEEVVVAGRYEFRPEGIGSFVYARSYLERDTAFALDPRHLPLSPREFRTTRNRGLFGALRDVAPDAWGRLVIERTGTPETELDFLLSTSDARVGALSFAPTPDVRPLDLGDVLDLGTIGPSLRASDHLQARVAGELAVPEVDPRLLQPGSSLGGARPKANVMDGRGQLWIAKFPARNDPWDNAVVEHGYLRLAAECGLRVPESRVIEVDGRRVLLVRRFDTSPGPARRSFLSAHTLLGLDVGETPQDRSGWSYNDLAHVIRAESVVPGEDTRELFRRVVFNALTTNEDDHPRNHAMIRTTDGWRLSPAYDLTPSRTRALETRKHAMRVGRLRAAGMDPRLMRRANLVSAAGDFLLEEARAESIIDEMKESIVARWRDVLSRAGATEATLALVEHAFPERYPGFEYLTG